MTLTVDIHALQSVPPSLINRDETGAPKSAIFGGIPRQRVSSQAWKRAIRQYIKDNINPDLIGTRSRDFPEKVAQLLELKGVERDEAIRRSEELFDCAGVKLKPKRSKQKSSDAPIARQTSALLLLSKQQINRAVEKLIALGGNKIKKPEAKMVLNDDISIDIAMFGRMLAAEKWFNVDATIQVAHAIGVHASAPEFDYFTAVDDLSEEDEKSGAGMLASVQMMSSTLYRYATINVEGLSANLGSSSAAKEAAGLFLEAFIKSMPTGKINTFANQTLPELVLVTVQDTRPVSLVNAFEQGVEGNETTDRRTVAAERLAREAQDVQDVYGLKPEFSYVLALGDLSAPFKELAESVTLPQLTDKVTSNLDRLLGKN